MQLSIHPTMVSQQSNRYFPYRAEQKSTEEGYRFVTPQCTGVGSGSWRLETPLFVASSLAHCFSQGLFSEVGYLEQQEYHAFQLSRHSRPGVRERSPEQGRVTASWLEYVRVSWLQDQGMKRIKWPLKHYIWKWISGERAWLRRSLTWEKHKLSATRAF